MNTSDITGLGTATVTPFTADGSLDVKALKRFMEFQIDGGVNFLVPCGTTGETPTLTDDEQDEVLRITLEVADGRVPVVAGCTSNDTRSVVARGKRIKALGIDHVLSASPYYNKPTQEGIYRHMKALHEDAGVEILVYNVQGRTASNMLPETVARMAEEGIIFAIKEASGNILQIQKICQLVGDKITVLSGDDSLTMPLMSVGGRGVISVASNVVPRQMRDWVDTMTEGNYRKAREQMRPLLPLFDGLFVESNPIPVKGACSKMGLMEANYRLPMVPPAASTMTLLQEVMAPFNGA